MTFQEASGLTAFYARGHKPYVEGEGRGLIVRVSEEGNTWVWAHGFLRWRPLLAHESGAGPVLKLAHPGHGAFAATLLCPVEFFERNQDFLGERGRISV